MYTKINKLFMYNAEETTKEINIRHHFDDNSGEFYFSIVDVIDNLELSTDPRNYWKVLKNRLKKGHNELVTECNQLKMKASDGKYYLTDVATSHIILQIIQIIAPVKVVTFERFFNHIEIKSVGGIKSLDIDKELSTSFFEEEKEIPVDVYQKENYIFVTAMLAGIEPEDIFVSTNCKTLTIKINRQGLNNLSSENYLYQELCWGKFSRTVSLPCEIDLDKIDTTFTHGLLIIKLFILDKTRTKIIKVK